MNAVLPKATLPYGRQSIGEDDIAAVVEALRAPYLTTGPRVAAFEEALREHTGAQHAIAVSNGTAALHLIARAMGLGPGTLSIIPSITFLATANAVRLNGGDVIFADVDPKTGLMTAETLQGAIRAANGRRISAAFPVHYAGALADMKALSQVAGPHGIQLIEDACHAIGSSSSSADGITTLAGCGTYSAATCFSFHPVKTIATGEGGAIALNDSVLAKRIARDRNHGLTRDASDFVDPHLSLCDGSPNPWAYEMDAPGLNYRLTDIQSALGLSQLKKLRRFKEERALLHRLYCGLFAGGAPFIQMLDAPAGQAPAWHLAVALIDFESLNRSRANVMRRLAARGIATQVHYIPVHRQPYYRALFPDLVLPGADEFYARTLSLPLFSGLEYAGVARVTEELLAALGLENRS